MAADTRLAALLVTVKPAVQEVVQDGTITAQRDPVLEQEIRRLLPRLKATTVVTPARLTAEATTVPAVAVERAQLAEMGRALPLLAVRAVTVPRLPSQARRSLMPAAVVAGATPPEVPAQAEREAAERETRSTLRLPELPIQAAVEADGQLEAAVERGASGLAHRSQCLQGRLLL